MHTYVKSGMRYNDQMEWLKNGWKRTPTKVRKPFIFILGCMVVAAGIVLLPLPGPGWAVIFAGFAILATEFEFAEYTQGRLVGFLKRTTGYGKPAWQRFKRWLRS